MLKNKEVMRQLIAIPFVSAIVLASAICLADESKLPGFAEVTFVSASQQFDGSWCIKTSVLHNDEGWEHYANGWAVFDAKDNLLWERPLTHPHVNEQPFTRRLCDVQIPAQLNKLVVKAKCNQHGYGEKAIVIDLGTDKGSGYEVTRFE